MDDKHEVNLLPWPPTIKIKNNRVQPIIVSPRHFLLLEVDQNSMMTRQFSLSTAPACLPQPSPKPIEAVTCLKLFGLSKHGREMLSNTWIQQQTCMCACSAGGTTRSLDHYLRTTLEWEASPNRAFHAPPLGKLEPRRWGPTNMCLAVHLLSNTCHREPQHEEQVRTVFICWI